MLTLFVPNVTFSESDKLVGAKNYQFWSIKVEKILREKDLWDVVPPPQVNTQSSITVDVEKKERAIFIFTFTLTNSIILFVKRFHDDPAELWEALRKKFESASIQRKLNLKTQLLEARMTEGTSVKDYLKKVKSLVIDLGRVGEEVQDKELVHLVQLNLPESWSFFTSCYGMLYDKDPDATTPRIWRCFSKPKRCAAEVEAVVDEMVDEIVHRGVKLTAMSTATGGEATGNRPASSNT